MTESDILHEENGYWVGRVRGKQGGYRVYRNGITYAESTEMYALTADGLSIAIARCKYLPKRARERDTEDAIEQARRTR